MHLREMEALADILSPSEKRELADYLLNALKGMGPPPGISSEPVRSYARTDLPDIEKRLLQIRPRTLQGMRNCIFTMYKPAGGISDDEISDAILSVSRGGSISIQGDRIVYPVPRGFSGDSVR